MIYSKADPKRNRGIDVIFVLKTMDGKKTLSSIGMVDSRLLKGENRLHAKMDPQTTLWHLEYDNGILPPPLRQQFTGLEKLLQHTKGYFERRNIEIVELLD